MSADTHRPALAYSYIRFSTPDQAKGDSLRRQTQAAADWCKRQGNVALDTSTTLHDLGRSAFLGEHRRNPDRNALAAFLKLVEQGKVPRGSYLLLESLDRLSREHIRPALTLLLQLIEGGVRVVQLIPVEAVYDDRVEPMQLMMAIMELSRGHSESATKSQRVGSAWAEKKAAASAGRPQPEKRHNRVNGMAILTHKLPAWVREVDGRLELIESAAAAVRRVFELSRAGYGAAALAKKLLEDEVPPIGRAGHWSRSYVSKLLTERRAVGEFQPRKRGGAPDGPPIKDYFPAVVSEADWQAARGGARTRRQPGTASAPAGAGANNIFAGLVSDARDGGSYYAAQRIESSGAHHWALINTNSAEGRARCVSFPLAPFERAVLSKLREIDPAELFANGPAVSSAVALAADLAREDEDIARLERELEAGGEGIPSVVRVLGRKEARRKQLAEELAAAKAREATPAAAAWGEYRSLYDALEQAADRGDARLRLRAALRRIVARVTLLVAPQGRTRLAAVRLDFAGSDQHRDYLIYYRPSQSNGRVRSEPVLSVISAVWPMSTNGFDLRDPVNVPTAEAVLLALKATAPTA